MAEGDTIYIGFASFWGGLPTSGNATGIFGASDSASFGAGEKFHFDTSTRVLWYDSDGAGVGAAALAMAVLENSTVDAAHIVFG